MSGILTGFFEKRMVDENSGSGFLSRGLHSFDTASGIVINKNKALRSSAVYACVDILSTSTAMLPLHVHQKIDAGARLATEHYLYDLLDSVGNPEMTAFEVRRLQMVSVLLRGNSYNYLEENQRGEITAIWPLNPDGVHILRDRKTFEKWYAVEMPEYYGGGFQLIHTDSIWHWTGLATERGMGMTLIQMQKQSIGLSLATEEYGARFFSNGAIPGFVLASPAALSDRAYDRLKESWENRHQGLDNAHKVAILEEGTKPEKLGISPADAQLLETEKYQDKKIARIFRVPPHMIADLDRSTNNNIEHQGLEFVQFSLMHWLVNYEKSANMHLLTNVERKTYYVKHSVNGLLRGDMKTRYEAYRTSITNGIQSINEVRGLEELNSIGPVGDKHLVPLNMIFLDDLASGDIDKSDDNGDISPRNQFMRDYFQVNNQNETVSTETVKHIPGRTLPHDIETRAANSAVLRHRQSKTYKRVIKNTADRIVRREVNDISGQLKKQLERGYEAFLEWLAEFYQGHEDFVYKNMLPILQTYAEMVADTAMEEIDAKVAAERIEKFIQRYTEEYARRHVAIGEKRIQDTMSKAKETGADVEESLRAELDHWKDAKGADIAMWESVRSNNAVAHFIYQASTIVSILRWATFGESCPYCDSLNGKKIGINEAFLLAGEALDPDGKAPLINKHDTKHPPVHGGCDCMVVAGG